MLYSNTVSLNFYQILKSIFVVFVLYDPLIHKLTLHMSSSMIEDLEPQPGELDRDEVASQLFVDGL